MSRFLDCIDAGKIENRKSLFSPAAGHGSWSSFMKLDTSAFF
jgi:hypothetical protein